MAVSTWASRRRCTRRSPTTSWATTWPARSWTTSSQPPSRALRGRPARRSPRRRITRSARKAWGSRRRSAPLPRSRTPSWTPCGTSASATSTSRSRRRRCGPSSTRKVSPPADAAMTGSSMFARAAELQAAGRPFAVATVVAVKKPTSARPGASGIIHPDGTIEGWVGGSCAQPVVVREALRAIGDGQPRLLRLSKDGPGEGRRADGVIELVMTCHSGGTLEIYVEPHLPAPLLWVAGTTPIAGALATLGAASGWRVSVFDPFATAEDFPAAHAVRQETALGRVDPEASPYLVVATQGQWD